MPRRKSRLLFVGGDVGFPWCLPLQEPKLGAFASVVTTHVLVRCAAYQPFQRPAGSADGARVDDDGVTLRCGGLPRRTARERCQGPSRTGIAHRSIVMRRSPIPTYTFEVRLSLHSSWKAFVC